MENEWNTRMDSRPQEILSPAPKIRCQEQPMRRSILLVDDEEAIREVLTDLLEGEDLRVLCAADGHEGIALLREHAKDINLVLLDLTMPGMAGEEAFKRFKEIDPSVRVVVTSGYSEEEAREKIPSADLIGFIQKPFRWNQVTSAIVGFAETSHRLAS